MAVWRGCRATSSLALSKQSHRSWSPKRVCLEFLKRKCTLVEELGHRGMSDEVLGQLHVTRSKQEDDGSCAGGRPFTGPSKWPSHADLAILYPKSRN